MIKNDMKIAEAVMLPLLPLLPLPQHKIAEVSEFDSKMKAAPTV